MWRVVGILLALIVVLSVAGVVLRALRWLLVVALVLAVVAAVVAGSFSSRR
jgi:hypothetical protein